MQAFLTVLYKKIVKYIILHFITAATYSHPIFPYFYLRNIIFSYSEIKRLSHD